MEVNGYSLGPNKDLSHAILFDVDLSRANLKGAILHEAKLSGTDFSSADLFP